MHNINTFKDFATNLNYSKHPHLSTIGQKLILSNVEPISMLNPLTVLFQSVKDLKDTNDYQKALAISIESLSIVRSNLSSKIDSWFTRTFFPSYTKNIQQQIQVLDRGIRVCQAQAEPKSQASEEVFRLHFLASLPKKLKIQHAPGEAPSSFKWKDGKTDTAIVKEQKVIEWLSKAVFESEAVQKLPVDQRQGRYMEIMLGAYQGDHLLIEDNPEHTHTKELAACGAIIRGSSHYEKGRKILEWKEGAPVYDSELHESLEQASVHHYGLTGKHIKHVLFNAVDMGEIEEVLIPGMTKQQAEALAANNKLKLNGKLVTPATIQPRHFTAFQFESSPDCEGNNLKDPLFYTHRLRGFILYRILKNLGFQKANIGAYGYGFTDANPVVLKKYDPNV